MTDTEAWSLPFAERYHQIERALKDVPAEIARTERLIADAKQARSRMLADYHRAQRAMGTMLADDAEQVASIRAHRDAVLAALRERGWNV